jgi:hypothetical protein
MSTAVQYVIRQENQENSFTRLFSLFKRYQCTQDGLPILAFERDDLELMHQHSDDAITVLLQGLQDLGHLLGAKDKNKMVNNLKNIGYFISSVSNLIEALDSLRSDAGFVLNIK